MPYLDDSYHLEIPLAFFSVTFSSDMHIYIYSLKGCRYTVNQGIFFYINSIKMHKDIFLVEKKSTNLAISEKRALF